MRRLIILTCVLFLLALPRQAFAHGLGQSTDLPIPLWLYLFGAAVVVLVSFVQIGLFVGEGHTLRRYPRFNLLRVGPLRALLTARPVLFGLRLLSVALFLLVVLSGLLGRQDASFNFAPTFVWIIWWVGFSFFAAFVGNIWPLVNPWKVLFEWADGLARRLGAEKGLELHQPYPGNWGVWPALMFYGVFVWTELVFVGATIPLILALFILLYSIDNWTGMIFFGKETWLRRGEAFSVLADLLAKFAPSEVRVTNRKLCEECSGICPATEGGCVNCYECFAQAAPEDRELNIRPWAVGLSLPEQASADRLVFIIFVLASVAYHSLVETTLWTQITRGTGGTSIPKTLGLIVLPLVFLAIYLGFMKLSQVFVGVSLGFRKLNQLFGEGYAPYRDQIPVRRLAEAYVYSLVPIAVAYYVAHYYTYLLIQGQAAIRLLSDPFGWGWDLFGTSGYQIDASFISPDFVWGSQIAVIIAGHVVALYLAHLVALRLLRNHKLAMRSQYPMLALMVLYTCFSLWLLSQ